MQEQADTCVLDGDIEEPFNLEKIAAIVSDQTTFNAILPDIILKLAQPGTTPMKIANLHERWLVYLLRKRAIEIKNEDPIFQRGALACGRLNEWFHIEFCREVGKLESKIPNFPRFQRGQPDSDQVRFRAFMDIWLTREHVVEAVRHSVYLLFDFDFAEIDHNFREHKKKHKTITEEIIMLYKSMHRAKYQFVLALIPDLQDDEAKQIFQNSNISAQDVFDIAHGNTTLDITADDDAHAQLPAPVLRIGTH